MKRGKTRVQTEPVPTENPKPRFPERSAKKAKAARKPISMEPVPQPAQPRIAKPRNGSLAVRSGIEPQPQPRPARAPQSPPAVPAPVAKRAAARKATKIIKQTFEEIAKAVSLEPPHEPAPQAVAAVSSTVAKAPELTAQSPIRPRAARQPRPVPIEIPPILLEPDHVPGAEPTITGPGARFVVAPTHETAPVVIPKELPESYGTKQVFLAARDPYWLLASWDLDRAQQQRYTARSASGALTVRLRREHAEGPIHLEVHTQAHSKDWFIYAGAPDTTFVAELGFHEKNSGEWRHISVSKAVTTPRDRATAPPQSLATPLPLPHISEPAPAVSEEPHAVPWREEIVFATTEINPSRREGFHQGHEFNRVDPWAQSFPSEQRAEAAQAFEGARNSESPRFEILPEAPRRRTSRTPAWTPAQAKALDELISFELKKTQQGSVELEELIRRHLGRPEVPEQFLEESMEIAPSSLEMLERAQAEAGEAPSSLEAIPSRDRRKGFWFRVNAELIIYGSTEPDARVTIGGRPIRLREDGTFSYRFALPDGSYELPAVAISRDGDDARMADLRFARATNYLGAVEMHPQDPALKTPAAANL